MAHFAKLGINGKVIAVLVVANADTINASGVEDENVGIQFLERSTGWPLWKKTSYNTKAGKYYNQDGSEGDQTKALEEIMLVLVILMMKIMIFLLLKNLLQVGL
jgi:hypothetical protein